jgi:DedD protein
MPDSSDVQLQLKKQARRRLVGAIAFAGLAAVVLPMVMDEEPKQQVQDVQIIIPGQDPAPYNPKALAAKSTAAPVPASAAVTAQTPVAAKPASTAKPEVMQGVMPGTLASKPAETPVAKPAAKTPEKKVDKPAEKALKSVDETQRAATILGGKPQDAGPANAGGAQVILIGAFANAANVKQLQSKLGELGIKTFTEPLDSPQGKKTRVRAGPFPNRETAEKALEKMKRIGISGVVAAKQ